ncbi:MAG: FAD-binding oxidoreductase [Candidatus Diapherotrites archaeon]
MEFNGRILSIQDCIDAGEVFARIIKIEAPQSFDFKAGQFVMVAFPKFKLQGKNELKWSAFSVASSPLQKGFIELCVDGSIKEYLKVNDFLKVRGPFGDFTLNEDFVEAAFIAMGSGIAPMISMVRTLCIKGITKPFYLFFGSKNHADCFYEKELEELSRGLCNNFSFIPVRSEMEFYFGKCNGFLQDEIKGFNFRNPRNIIEAYVCGNPQIVPIVIEELKKEGFKEDRIHSEIQDKRFHYSSSYCFNLVYS